MRLRSRLPAWKRFSPVADQSAPMARNPPASTTRQTTRKGTTRRTKSHGSSVKDDRQYEALRRQGASKEKAARVANAGRRGRTGSRGGSSARYEDRTKQELYEKAKKVGIEGRSRMDKKELISALRNH